MSLCASPGGSAAFQCHCSQRDELTSEPFSSAKQVVGSWKTSVWMLAGSDGILRAEILPEARGLGVQRIHHDEEFQLAQRGADLALVGERLQRVEALADVAVHLAVRHHLEGAR